jgi:hypothetical protein
MPSALRLQPTTHVSRGSGRPSVVESPALAVLVARFARFRREHRRGARVPFELRAATLAALQSGVKQGELCRACGISWTQVMTWKAVGRKLAKPAGGAAADVRVFSVVDEPAAGHAPVVSTDQTLELRLGPWSVSVRLCPEPAGRR